MPLYRRRLPISFHEPDKAANRFLSMDRKSMPVFLLKNWNPSPSPASVFNKKLVLVRLANAKFAHVSSRQLSTTRPRSKNAKLLQLDWDAKEELLKTASKIQEV